MSDSIRVVVCPAEAPPRIELVENELAPLQALVGGRIEIVGLAGEYLLMVNEHGRMLGLPKNHSLPSADLVGTIVLMRSDGRDDFASLDEADAERLLQKVIAQRAEIEPIDDERRGKPMKPIDPLPLVNTTPRNCDEERVLLMNVYEVCDWHPERDGEGKPTQVHLVMSTERSPLGVRTILRMKSRRAIDELIDILQRHRDDVWPGDA